MFRLVTHYTPKTAPLWKAFDRNIINTYTFVNANVLIKVLNFDQISFERLIKATMLQFMQYWYSLIYS